nr:uncharacterized protein LOC117275456 [Nicotiana tomentosiformis]
MELASYQLKEVAYSWFELWEESHEESSPPAKWNEFTDAFIDYFLPFETRASCTAEFEDLKQGSMSARVRRFVQGLSPLVIDKDATTALNYDMNYGKKVAFSQSTKAQILKNRMEREVSRKARSAGNFGGSSSCVSGGRAVLRGGSSRLSQSFSQSSASAPKLGPGQ